ncbi:MAG: metal-dependent hydrolase [Desulfobacteraceae bacterium]|jgi:hypothetical protein|nr:metal-dependent hydrolase [Desulfobacteraceae bacterium]
MPNTLAHIAVQGPGTRALMRNAGFGWILLGCIIPDVPWILLRAAGFALELNPYDLRLYAIVQSSLVFCLVLSLFFASFSKTFLPVFGILATGSLMHLLLDAMQTKWGNGVHLLAPLSWKLLGFHLFWPENAVTYILTASGLVVFALQWRKASFRMPDLVWRPVASTALAVAYLLLPALFLQGPAMADNHFVQTLRHVSDRAGKSVEMDRVRVSDHGGVLYVRTFAGEEIPVRGLSASSVGTVSLKGTFLEDNYLSVTRHHLHLPLYRDTASILGLCLVTLYWIAPLWRGCRVKDEGKGAKEEADDSSDVTVSPPGP